jgi:hypothetical protein
LTPQFLAIAAVTHRLFTLYKAAMQRSPTSREELNTHQAADSSGRTQNNGSTLSFDRLAQGCG